MADLDIDEIKKLSPEQRLRVLKELEEKSRKEIEEARKLMAESEREIEVKEEHERDMPIPQLAAVDIESLFTPEEKEIFKTKRFVPERRGPAEDETERKEAAPDEEEKRFRGRRGALEEVLDREKKPELSDQEAHQYGARLEQIRDRVYQLQNMTDDDPARFKRYESHYKEELEQMREEWEGMQRKYKTAGESIAEEATIGSQIDRLLGWYRR